MAGWHAKLACSHEVPPFVTPTPIKSGQRHDTRDRPGCAPPGKLRPAAVVSPSMIPAPPLLARTSARASPLSHGKNKTEGDFQSHNSPWERIKIVLLKVGKIIPIEVGEYYSDKASAPSRTFALDKIPVLIIGYFIYRGMTQPIVEGTATCCRSAMEK